jgi:hypothetical protein
MDIKSGQAESHPTPLPLDASATPGVVAPIPRFPSGAVQGGVVTDISGVDFTGEAAAAMHAGMAADADRRGRYAASMSPIGASGGDQMAVPVVPDNALPPAQSYGYPYAGTEPTATAAGWDYDAQLPG